MYSTTTKSKPNNISERLAPMMTVRIWFNVVIVLMSSVDRCGSQLTRIHGKTFHDTLTRNIIEPDLGTSTLQGHFDRASFLSTLLNGTDMVNELATKVEEHFQQSSNAVRELVKVTESGFAGFGPQSAIDKCCNYSSSQLEYTFGFKNRIDLRHSCCRIARDTERENVDRPYSEDILRAFLLNRQNIDLIKWQYIGTESGALALFPAHKADNCDDYDNRFRPWYVETVTPEPKDIVLVIDRSDSMSRGNAWSSAVKASATLVDTLNPNDRIGLVAFGDEALTPVATSSAPYADCFAKRLAFATQENKDTLIKFVKSLVPSGNTHYLKAFGVAFDLLKATPPVTRDTRRRNLAIVFLTDGTPTDPRLSLNLMPIFDLIEKKNAELKNAVSILTYGLGDALTTTGMELLQNISAQQRYNSSFEPPRPGKFTQVDSVADLRDQLGTYYDFFRSSQALSGPVITVPYYDFFGLGLVISVCLPIHDVEGILGVGCVDVRVADILSDAAFLNAGTNTYAFVVDGKGRVLLHPELPLLYSLQHSPSYFTIKDMEHEDDMMDVIDSMVRGQSGSKSLVKKFIQNRGTSKREGVQVTSLPAEVHWRQITGTNLSLCLVLATSDKLFDVTASVPRSFYYHRLDLVDTHHTCNYFSKLRLKDASAVKFSGVAFVDPYRYYDVAESSDRSNRYKAYMLGNNNTGADSLFKEGVRDMVSITNQMDEFWSNRNHEYMISSFLATFNGIIRIYPGTALDAMYEARDRSWFKRAVANQGKYTFAVPYIDAFGFGLITTLSQTVYSGSNTGLHTEGDSLSAVVGLDMRLGYIGFLLNHTFPACGKPSHRCFLVDTSGYLIYDQDFENQDIENLDHLHIIENDPDIANFLINGGYLQASQCVDFYSKMEYKTWKLYIQSGYIQQFETFPFFELQTVQNSNVYLGIRKARPNPSTTCKCPLRDAGVDTDTYICKNERDACECPCKKPTIFDFCSNTFISDSDPSPACSQEPPEAKYTNPITNESSLLLGKPICQVHNCTKLTSTSECGSVLGCRWCQPDADEAFTCLSEPDCILLPLRTELPHSTTIENRPTTDGTANIDTKDENLPLIIGVCVGGAVLIALILGSLVAIKKCRKSDAPARTTIIIPDVPSEQDMSLYSSVLSDGVYLKTTPATTLHYV